MDSSTDPSQIVIVQQSVQNSAEIAAAVSSGGPLPAPIVTQSILGVADLRARLLRTKPVQFKLFTAADGTEVALVKPSEGARGELEAARLAVDSNGKMRAGNLQRRSALAVIAMVHAVDVDPSTGTKRPGAKVFAEPDLPTLLDEQSSSTSTIAIYGPACERYLVEGPTAAEAKEAAKNA